MLKGFQIISTYRIFIGFFLILSLISGYFYFYNQFWTHLDPKTFDFLVEYTGSRFRGHRGQQVLIHRDFYAIAERVNHYAVKNNLHLIITQSFRPPRKKLRNTIVEPAVKSNHLAGHAIDFNMVYGGKVFESKDLLNNGFPNLPAPLKHFIIDIQKDPVMRWGGDFENQDPVHLDDALNIHDINRWELHYHQCLADYVDAVPKWRTWIQGVFNRFR